MENSLPFVIWRLDLYEIKYLKNLSCYFAAGNQFKNY